MAGIFSGSGVARVTESADKIHVQLIRRAGSRPHCWAAWATSPIPLPNLPMGMTLQSITLTSQGALVHITGHDIAFGN